MPDNPLNRTLSLPVVTLYGLGTIIGAGIYVLIGEVAGASGYLTPVAFLIASIIACFSAFSFAELSSRFPLSAGEAVYVDRAFGVRAFSIIIGLIMVCVGIIASATLARGFVGYLNALYPMDEQLAILILMLFLGGVAAWGIAQSAWVAVLSTLIEIAGLLAVIWAARGNLSAAPDLLATALAQCSVADLRGILAGSFISFFAFLGFEDIVNLAEEVKNPSRNLPWAVILSLLIAATLYLGIAIAAVATVTPAELAGDQAPLALVFERATGATPVFIIVISIAAIINGTLIMLIMATRILYGMSSQQWLPATLSSVKKRTRTPLVSTLLIASLILVLALWLPVATLAVSTSFLTLLVFLSVNLALLVIKLRERSLGATPTGHLSYPLWLPLAGAMSSAAFILTQIYLWLN